MKRTVKDIEKRRADEALLTSLREELLARRKEVHNCPTVAILLTERDIQRGDLDDPKVIRRRIQHVGAEVNSRFRVSLRIPRQARHDLQRRLSHMSPDQIGSGSLQDTKDIVVEVDPTKDTHLHDWLMGGFDKPNLDYRYGSVGYGSTCLLPSAQISMVDGISYLHVHSFLPSLMERADELGVEDGFEYRDIFRLWKVPPANQCRPGLAPR